MKLLNRDQRWAISHDRGCTLSILAMIVVLEFHKAPWLIIIINITVHHERSVVGCHDMDWSET
jgi:hypothetical protein